MKCWLSPNYSKTNYTLTDGSVYTTMYVNSEDVLAVPHQYSLTGYLFCFIIFDIFETKKTV